MIPDDDGEAYYSDDQEILESEDASLIDTDILINLQLDTIDNRTHVQLFTNTSNNTSDFDSNSPSFLVSNSNRSMATAKARKAIQLTSLATSNLLEYPFKTTKFYCLLFTFFYSIF